MIELHTVGRRVARRVVGATEWNLRRRIRAGGGRLPADVPHPDWMNSMLKTRRQVDEAIREVERCGLVRHPDPAKNWDALAAVRTILGQTTTGARVLEMGARLYSVMLPWLYQHGYRHLIGIDLVHDEPVCRGPIHYEFGDLTRTRFAAGSFDVVCAMSVVRHRGSGRGVGIRPALRSTLALATLNGTTLADIPRLVKRRESDGAG